jgi:hypothetical protein
MPPSAAHRPRPVATRPEQPTHADIMDRIGDRQDEADRHADLMTMTVQRIEHAVAALAEQVASEMAAIRDSIGDEGQDEYGKPVGRGVVGRLMRMERRLGRYDGWVKWATGAVASALLFAGVLWWAWQPKLEAFFR